MNVKAETLNHDSGGRERRRVGGAARVVLLSAIACELLLLLFVLFFLQLRLWVFVVGCSWVPFWSFLENFQALGFWVVVSTFECSGCVLLFSRAYPEENGMSRVYVGNLDSRAIERELEDEFRVYGVRRRLAFFYLSTLFLPWSTCLLLTFSHLGSSF
jgi:hypothetical protein